MPNIDMIVNDGVLNDGRSYDAYHKETMDKIAGTDYTIGSTLDKLYKVIDSIEYSKLRNWQEIGLANDIDHATGLQLDDIGDNIGLERQGKEDDEYRFLLKLRWMTLQSNGTMSDLLQIASTILGCKTTDISMTEGYHIDDNGQIVGQPNVLNINKIDISTVQNTDLISQLAIELQKACSAPTRINTIEFFDYADQNVYVAPLYNVITKITVDTANRQLGYFPEYDIYVAPYYTVKRKYIVDTTDRKLGYSSTNYLYNGITMQSKTKLIVDTEARQLGYFSTNQIYNSVSMQSMTKVIVSTKEE